MSKTIGLIGLGNMGSSFAANMVAREYEVIGHDKVAKQCLGVTITDLKTLIGKCKTILMSLPDSKVIEPLILSEKGAIKYLTAGQTIIDLSSASMGSTRRIHAALKAKGVFYLDAAVSGGAGKAADGTISIMVGGDKDVFERNRALLAEMGSNIYYMGESGAGDAMKGLNNYLTAITLSATGEAMILAKKLGLDLEQVLNVLNHSSGESYASKHRFPRIIKGDYIETGVSIKLMVKDVEIYRECAQECDVPTPTGDFTASIYRLAFGLGKGHLVNNRIVEILGDLAGGIRLHD
jgi:3-hydroxyisobutyrate dehydrogenase-like beta-hydroxyacid dehydrogenase